MDIESVKKLTDKEINDKIQLIYSRMNSCSSDQAYEILRHYQQVMQTEMEERSYIQNFDRNLNIINLTNDDLSLDKNEIKNKK